MTFKGPGGHSFQEFGLPSAIHAMGRAIAKISELQPPSDPKTTFTVGTVSGGTSVNAIAAEAKMAVDMRSNSEEELLKLEARLLELVKEAVADENARWKTDKISVDVRLIGDRPAGIVSMDSPIIQATQRAVTAITRGPRATFAGSSTNSNIAMSLGIPAVTIGGGGEGGNWHSRNEWYKPTDAWMGPQNALLDGVDAVGARRRDKTGATGARGEVAASGRDGRKRQFADEALGLPVPVDAAAEHADHAVDRADAESDPCGLGDSGAAALFPVQRQFPGSVGMPADLDSAGRF